MKWYCALNAASVSVDDMHARCVEVAVLSALQNTSLHPHFLFDGPPCALTERLQRMGTTVIHHTSSLASAIVAAKPDDPGWQQIARGAYLRIDIPLIETDSEYILYTDCDVLFLRDPDVATVRPRFFAVAPEFAPGDFANMNSGVMVMNVSGMRGVAEEFETFIRAGMAEFPAFDQGALQQFFRGRFEPLADTMNWKPYWGINPAAEVIHFHGPKPPHALRLLNNELEGLPQVYIDLFSNSPAAYREVTDIWQAYQRRTSRM